MPTNAERIARLQALRVEATEGGGATRIDRQHAMDNDGTLQEPMIFPAPRAAGPYPR